VNEEALFAFFGEERVKRTLCLYPRHLWTFPQQISRRDKSRKREGRNGRKQAENQKLPFTWKSPFCLERSLRVTWKNWSLCSTSCDARYPWWKSLEVIPRKQGGMVFLLFFFFFLGFLTTRKLGRFPFPARGIRLPCSLFAPCLLSVGPDLRDGQTYQP